MDCARITDNLFAGSCLLDLKDPAANLVASVPTLAHRRLGIEVLIPTGLFSSRAKCVQCFRGAHATTCLLLSHLE